jgi:fructokinase
MAHHLPALAQVLSMGEILVDFIVADSSSSLDVAQTFIARSGGAPANCAVALARLGVPSGFCGVAGTDPFGAKLRSELGREGVDTSRLRQTEESPTTLAFAWKDRRGDGHFWLLRNADATLSARDAEAAGIPELRALVVGSVALSMEPSRQAIERAVALAMEHGVPVVFDVNLRPTLWPELERARPVCDAIARASEIVKLSLDDASGLYGSDISPDATIERILDLGPGCVVVTDGERGCWFASRSDPRVSHVPPFVVEAVEPTGAGDAFGAALIARAIAADWAPPAVDDIRYAAAAGALATTKRGAWEGLPSHAQLEAFLAGS